MLAAALLLAQQGWLPWWFAVLLIGRDVLIVAGALAYHFVVGHVEMAPTWLSKLNTLVEFVLLTLMLALAAGHIDEGAWFLVLLYGCTATVVASGAHYVWTWGRRALRHDSASRSSK
jgi:cardiolipin synthase (CMP-forming)